MLLPTTSDPRIAQYLPLVRAKARQFSRSTFGMATIDDLIAVGMVALWNSTLTFDDSRGCSFLTYAKRNVHWAMVGVVEHFGKPHRGAREIKVPIHVHGVDVHGDDALAYDPVDPAPIVSETIEATERSNAVMEAIASLPPKLGRVIEQHYFFERTFEQIGADEGVTRQAIQQREVVAIEMLRERLIGVVE